MLLIAIAAFLAGILISHGYHIARAENQDEKLRQALWCVDFWHEHCDNWHQLAVAAGAGQRKQPQALAKAGGITVPDPPQAEIVAAGRTGIHVWRN